MKSFIKVIFILLLFVSASCKVTFNRELRGKIEAQGLDLKKIQYYNSKKIVLRRILTNNETKVASGEVRLNNGVYVEEIEIGKNTPGVCDSIFKGGMLVKFEEGVNRSLLFQENAYGGQYQLRTATVSGNGQNTQFYQTNNGEVTYEGKKYFISSMNNIKLKIKKKGSSEFDKKTRKASGIKIQ